MKFRALPTSLIGLGAVAASLALAFVTTGTGQEAPPKARKVVKSDAEWRKQLTSEQYRVTRQAGTERAFTGKLTEEHRKGVFECIGCDTPLFSSKTKFESGTGWPSFYAPYDRNSVDTSVDYKEGYPRTEVLCNTCGGHLGHVFDDGPPPTGLRYCMNSAALKFVKDVPAAKPADKKKVEKTTEKPKDEEKSKPVEKSEAPKADTSTPSSPK